MLYGTENPHGGDVYGADIELDFSANTNPFGTPQGVIDAIISAAESIHQYPDPYCRELVSAIAAFENIPREYILCGNGAAELIYAYSRAVKAATAVEPAPAFSEYSAALERTGCRIDRYYLNSGNNFDVDDGFYMHLEEKKPDVVFLCNPNNPTGRLVSRDTLERILHFCSRNNIRLFLDECFLNMTENGTSMKAYLADNPSLLILKAFTKCYGMAGVRLGYCLCSDAELLKKMSAESQPWNVSVLAQAAGVAALREEAFVKDAASLVSIERQWLSSELEALGYYVCPSEANYILFKGTPGLDRELLRSGIAIRNCGNYFGLREGWYRIAVRLHEQNAELIRSIRRIAGGNDNG